MFVASMAALAAFVVVLIAGIVVHKPLSAVPENLLKFGVAFAVHLRNVLVHRGPGLLHGRRHESDVAGRRVVVARRARGVDHHRGSLGSRTAAALRGRGRLPRLPERSNEISARLFAVLV